MKNEERKTKPLSIPLSKSSALKHWLTVMAETFGRINLSELQLQAYLTALDDLSDHELEIGCLRLLRQWNFSMMPPPAMIRECVAGALEEERANLAAERMKRDRIQDLRPRRLTVDEAWEDWEETERLYHDVRRKIGVFVQEKKTEMKKIIPNELCLATNERLAQLDAQKKLIQTKYPRKK